MNPRINQVLGEIRHLVEQSAWGPEIPSRSGSSDFQKNAPGVGEATNETDIQDAVDFYLNNVCQALVDEFGIEEEQAYDYVEKAADELSDEGMVPPLPTPDDGDAQAALWLGAAKSIGLEGYCIKMVRDELAASPTLRSSHSHAADLEDHDHDEDDMDAY